MMLSDTKLCRNVLFGNDSFFERVTVLIELSIVHFHAWSHSVLSACADVLTQVSVLYLYPSVFSETSINSVSLINNCVCPEPNPESFHLSLRILLLMFSRSVFDPVNLSIFFFFVLFFSVWSGFRSRLARLLFSESFESVSSFQFDSGPLTQLSWRFPPFPPPLLNQDIYY